MIGVIDATVQRESREAWGAMVAAAIRRDLRMLDLYTAVDRGTHLELVLQLSSPSASESVVLGTQVASDDARVASLAPQLPAAAWHERELAEMFGIRFDGHPDPRPLLLREAAPEPPLRRSTPLAARVDRPWPGTVPTEGRRSRRQLPPGVRGDWAQGQSP